MKRFAILFIVSGATISGAQDTTTKLPPMVTVTRQPARFPFDLPFGITVVSPDSLRPGQAHIAADQALLMIPGVTVANRTNPSQDVRVSVRGFGARSQFGVRSVRVIRDGMPLTLADGQTPLDYLDLESVGRIEVIRGTASALYGNASGGVIDIHSTDPPERITPEARVWFGSNAMRRTTAVVAGTSGGLSYQGNIGQTEADNYRAYSHQRLTNGFARASTTVGGTAFSLVGMGLHMPLAENPGALTQAQLDTAPQMADPASVAKKARKEVDQLQVGLSATRQIGAGRFLIAGFGGTRSLYNPLIPNVGDVQRTIAGASMRGDLDIHAVPGLRLTLGGDLQRQDDDRKSWASCNGETTTKAGDCPLLGAEEKGLLKVDQRELVGSLGAYTRLELERGKARANVGVRADAVRFEVSDHLIAPPDRDDSGVRTLRAVSPMAGMAVRLARSSSVYANYTTAFETPTTTELANQTDGSGGLNRDLQPQYATTAEVGAKGFIASMSYEVSIFRTRVRDELIAFQIAGRPYSRNAGRTKRDGVEVAGEWTPAWVDLSWAYSQSRFRFIDFVSGTTPVGGKLIPGIPERQLQVGALRHIGRGGFAVAEWVVKSRVWVNDANTVAAKRFDVLNLRGGNDIELGKAGISPIFAVNNVFDRRYVGSVAVNATGSKFFEPAPRRTLLFGARVMRGR